MLTKKLGDVGKKIHNGRSRNDQVLLDLKLFVREEINIIANLTNDLFKILIEKSETFKKILMPGYTHLQVAMPSSFGLWFGAYAESLTDDMQLMLAAYKIANQNPLGSAAGYGSSFPLNRQLTTELLGFENLNYNVVYAQMGRGKLEKTVAFAMSSIAATIAKFAADAALYMSQNFDFITLPEDFTTGSSIMPHKKNPDVFELLRGKCNKIQSMPNEFLIITNNLTSGYFRDLQTLKESFIPAFESLKECLFVLKLVLSSIKVRENILDDEKYKYLFTVEELNKKVLKGMPFRDAYKEMGRDIAEGKFKPEKNVHHTHEGSMGNLMNKEIISKMDSILYEFNFEKAEAAISKLLKI
jgi:argininosuccinate lyase